MKLEFDDMHVYYCAEHISEAISDNYNDNRLDSQSALYTVLKMYGSRLIGHILAGHISRSLSDGRYSEDNKTWASTYDNLNNESYNLKAHAGLVDMFTTTFRKYEKEVG